MMNGQNAKGFAEDQGFYLKDIIHGEPEALQILARRTGSNLDELTAASYRLTDTWRYERMGLALPRQTVFSPETRGCLACLREDALKSDLPWQAGMIFRANWHLSHVRVCIRHNLPLVLLWNDKDRLGRHDFASRVGLIFDRIMTRDMDGESIKISGFDRWVDERLQGRKTAIWLDQFDFHAAATFCELLGRSALLGQVSRTQAASHQLAGNAAAIGFEGAKGGEASIRIWLTEIQQRGGSPNDGANARFGALHDRLSRDLTGPEFEPFRSILRLHMLQTWPLGPGDQVLGVSVTQRVLHSVRSAAQETGLGTVRLRKALAKAGLVAKESAQFSDAWDVFDAAAAAPILHALSTGVGPSDAQKEFNFPRDQFELSVEAGFIRPIATGDDTHPMFARSDIQGFLNRLLIGATPRSRIHGSYSTIPKAARQLLCSSKDILQLLVDRKLTKIGRLTDQTGFLSILVDQREIRPLLERAEASGVTQAEVCRALGLAAVHVRALLKDSVLLATRAPNPLTKKPQFYIAPADFEEFNRNHVTLRHIAEDLGLDAQTVRSALLAVKVYPIGGQARPYGYVYKRMKIAAHFLREWPNGIIQVCDPRFLHNRGVAA